MTFTKRLPIYQAADAAVAEFADATGLACPTGCGECCEHQVPWVSIADMQEIAEARVARGEGEATLAAANAAGRDGACAIFEKGRLPGGCTEYELRPVLCRLFGFGGVRDKHARPVLAACKVHKRETPEIAERAIAFVEGGGKVPMLAEWQRTADGASDDQNIRILPINFALAGALERALLRADLAARAEPAPVSERDPEEAER